MGHGGPNSRDELLEAKQTGQDCLVAVFLATVQEVGKEEQQEIDKGHLASFYFLSIETNISQFFALGPKMFVTLVSYIYICQFRKY